MSGRYFEWNEAIIEEYFPEDNPSAYAYLPLDDEEIMALAEEYDICERSEAVLDFENAVKVELAQNTGHFACLSRWAKRWRTSGEDVPPYIAGLGFCVLAGSRMNGDEEMGVSSANYYVRLNGMIGRDESGIPPNFELLKNAWEDLSLWLNTDCQGSRGKSTVRTNKQFPHISYPLSQCLLRASDRRRLPDFFKTRDLRSSDAYEIGGERLFQLLRAWASRPGSGLSNRARFAIKNAKDRDLDEIVETVRRELESWDGSLRDARGKKRFSLRLRLIFKGRRSAVALYAELPSSLPEGPWVRSDTGHEVEVTRDPSSKDWSEPIRIQVDGDFLSKSFSLTAGDVALVWDKQSAIPFRAGDGPFTDWFMSQSQAKMWEPHFAVVRRDLEVDLEKYLNKQTGRQMTVVDDAKGIPNSWSLIGPFEYKTQPAAPPLSLSQFGPRPLQSMSIKGGLPLGNQFYLKGGEPDVFVSFDESTVKRAVSVDEVEYLSTEEFLQIELSKSKPGLSAGEHSIAGDVTRTFTTVETFGDVVPPKSGSLGYSLRRHGEYHPESQMAQPMPRDLSSGQVVISGATIRGDNSDLPSMGRDPIFFKGKYSSLVLVGQAVGEIAIPQEISAPRWMKEVGLARQFQFVEVRADFCPVWILEVDFKHVRRVKKFVGQAANPVGSPRPNTASSWFGAIFEWESVIPEDPGEADEWTQFVTGIHNDS